jgi:RHS repeat-associated protein
MAGGGQYVATVDFTATYTWDNMGRMTGMNYPLNGPQIVMSYDAMSRLSSETQKNCQTWDPNQNWVCNAWYNPATLATATYNFAGQMTALSDYYDSYGSAALQWNETHTYNGMMQLTNITNAPPSGAQSVNMTYNFSSTQNNGRILSSVDGVTGESVSYTYDSLSRLIAAATTSTGAVQWGNSYTYDGFGNLTSKVSTLPGHYAPPASPQVDSTTNRARMIGDNGFDANGNWLGPAVNQTNTWNVENQLIATGGSPSNGDPTYTYDPWGKRVLQYSVTYSNGPSGTLYFYSITGQRLGTYQVTYLNSNNPPLPQSTPLYFGGRLLAPVDRLGSVRQGPNGAVAYFPWGEERTTTSDGTDKFATYFRDVTNNGVGQDYANARYYNNNFGRFWSSDPAGLKAAAPSNPTSWNRYAYANDDPINMFDPSGLGSGFTGTDPHDPTSGGPGRTNGGCTTFADEGGWQTGGWTESLCWYTGIDSTDPNPTGDPSCNTPGNNLLPNGGGGGSCGDTGSNKTPLPSCGDATDQAFVSANFGGAAAAAATLGINGAVGDADILTLSAIESRWGTFKDTNGHTAYPGAWFGMQGVVGAKPYTGETACAPIPGTTTFCEMEFSSFGAAAAVFAKNEAGKVQGVSDPTTFFTNLKGVFAVGTPLPAYLKQMLPTEAWIQSCLKTLGLAQ